MVIKMLGGLHLSEGSFGPGVSASTMDHSTWLLVEASVLCQVGLPYVLDVLSR